ncbi:MAG TPA: helix-turn-helix domain-containing protein [Caulobacteraceae bacterium]|nr:helix-turn-helix domain-containing protein [Caulobacteraceae bacterium]
MRKRKEPACQGERRQFDREFKLMALRRMETAGNVEALAEELGLRRELLYKWRRKFETGGAEALRNSGRPRPSAVSPEALSAERRIAELERKLGEQALLTDFFKGALRRIEASRQGTSEPGVTASSPRSRR